ncbi:T-cell ecto-ADP-ribosyltransferase 1 [Tachysurus vachellii]|uniref:T-cell ecto-ADP-ribosyltransferase 1 n=1 Tax=Tachysurus vachellii TaxID=175792 RepID=UPI00296AFA1C|nr:T-cell ecto-ADP-ribosyltransferase 1 [Tachysurus vachellii]XP_060720033.1 T-cell ecto-ADP-ribosyltransferase 1 [Tachysurus vachellii]
MASEPMVRLECEGVSVFLLLVLAALQHTVKAKVKMLDMAPDAVDDDFLECRDKMLKVVTDSLLQEELDSEKVFKDLWSRYNGTCRNNIIGGTSLHMDALQAYGNSRVKFRTNFNSLVYSNGTNITTYRDFRFKSLHFLLSDSLKLLNPTNTCRIVYYGTDEKYKAVLGKEVRFGMFLNPTTSKDTAIEDVHSNDGSLFIINSCSVVDVEQKLCNCEELQCLLSPAEVFTVQKVEKVSEYKEITLNHSGFLSNHHCSFFQRNAADVQSTVSRTLTLLALMACVWSY